MPQMNNIASQVQCDFGKGLETVYEHTWKEMVDDINKGIQLEAAARWLVDNGLCLKWIGEKLPK